MSRNLEEEYKDLMKEEVPDLWNRIEAGLEPKQTGVKKRNLWRKYGPWGMAAAAACLCLAAIVPVMLNSGIILSGETEDRFNVPLLPDYGANEQNAGAVGATAADDIHYEASSAEENDGLCVIRGVVTDVSEEQDRTAYTVEIVESENKDLSAGDTVVLYDLSFMTEKLLIGEAYRFSAFIVADNEDLVEYWLYEAIPE